MVAAYRRQFSSALTKVNRGLRNFVRTEALEDVVVTQRLKREETIVEKLTQREKTMNLLEMQDIGGCRVVFRNMDDLRTIEGRIRRVWGRRIVKIDDYVAGPRQSGYRAVHIVIERDGRPIEIQLRTAKHHEWAQTVESFSGSEGSNYKQDGMSPVQLMMAAISRVEQYQERDEVPPRHLVDEMRKLGEAAMEHLLGSRREDTQ